MIPIYSLKARWYYVVIIATLTQIVIIYKRPCEIKNNDAISAIKRAKTASCKKELEDFATRTFTDIGIQLRRSCKLDSNEQRNKKVGCASDANNQLIKLDDKVTNSSVCLDLCFSYGHSHGGYNEPLEGCFCGDNDFLQDANQLGDCYKNQFDWYKVNNGIYYPKQSITSLSGVSNSSQNKIAFLLILSGRSTLQIQRLLKNIYSEAHIYYLHVDNRDDYLFNELLALENEYKNVFLAKRRFNTIWGGPSLITMIIDAIGHLSQHNWDYLINLSESDFPIKPLSALEAHLGSKSIYLKTHNIKGYNFIRKQGLDRNFYQCENRAWRMGKRQLPRGIIYSGGSDWFALPRDFCMYIIDNLNNSKSLVKPLMQIYNYTLLPVESFFHTLALNSEFCDRFSDTNLRSTNWHRKKGCKCQHKNVVDWCGCSPLVYRWSDWEKLKQSNSSMSLFFSRKFDPTISSSIINAVEHQLIRGASTNHMVDYDTRYWKNIYASDKLSKKDNHYSVMQQFGLFSLNQIKNLQNSKQTLSLELKSIDIYFNYDRFIGLIYHYCGQSKCIQLLIEKNSEAYLHNFNSKCFNLNGRTLKVIEVNHNFDTRERMFRDYRPLGHLSDIVVYHEWLVDLPKKSTKNSSEKLEFSWTNPQARLKFVQSVKLKGVSKPSRLSLAHRLNISKPLESGLWTLIIYHNNLDCLKYNFLVFDHSTFINKKIEQEQFNKFYSVSKVCIVNKFNNSESVDDLCSNQEWTLFSRRKHPSI